MKLVLIIATWLTVSAVAADNPAGNEGVIPFIAVDLKSPIEFDRHVYPILAEKCTSCHDVEGGVAEAKLDMTTVANLAKGGKRGPALFVGKGETSLVVRMAAHAVKPIMPPKGKNSLTSKELSILKRWIDEGAKPGTNLEPAKTEDDSPAPGPLPANATASYCVDFSPDGRWFAAGRGGKVVIYDAKSSKPVAEFGSFNDFVQSVRFSPTGSVLAVGAYQTVAFYSPPKSVKETWKELGRIEAGSGRVLAMDFSPDGKLLALGGGMPATPGELSIWKVDSRTKLTSIADSHSDSVLAVKFRDDGKRIATGGADKFVRTFEVATGKRLRQYEGHTEHVTGVAWFSGDKRLVSCGGDGTMRTWNDEAGEPIRAIVTVPKPFTGIRRVAGSNRIVASNADRQARLYDASDGRLIHGFGDSGEYLHAAAIAADGKRIAAVGPSGKPHAWPFDPNGN